MTAARMTNPPPMTIPGPHSNPGGKQVADETVDLPTPGGAGGDLFGLAVSLDGSAVYYVNDGNNMLYRLS